MKIERLSTTLIPVIDPNTYETYLGKEIDLTLENDCGELGIDYPDDVVYDVKGFHEAILETGIDFIRKADKFYSKLPFGFKVPEQKGEWYSPNEYNFMGDTIFFDADVDDDWIEKSLKAIESDWDEFVEFCRKEYGVDSFYPNPCACGFVGKSAKNWFMHIETEPEEYSYVISMLFGWFTCDMEDDSAFSTYQEAFEDAYSGSHTDFASSKTVEKLLMEQIAKENH